jgi:predicted ATP-dependent serine protease
MATYLCTTCHSSSCLNLNCSFSYGDRWTGKCEACGKQDTLVNCRFGHPEKKTTEDRHLTREDEDA